MKIKIGQILEIISKKYVYVIDNNNNPQNLDFKDTNHLKIGEWIVYWEENNSFQIIPLNEII